MHNINFWSLDVVYVDPDDECFSVYVAFPGSGYEYESDSFDSNKPNCLNYLKAYEAEFTSENSVRTPDMKDGTKFFTYTEEKDLRIMGVEARPKDFEGVFELYSEISMIENLINPLNDENSELSFWVYTLDQVINYQTH